MLYILWGATGVPPIASFIADYSYLLQNILLTNCLYINRF